LIRWYTESNKWAKIENMKQKVSVRVVVQSDNRTLLLKRANGRETILGKYELPGGKIDYGEQPEDALRRYLERDTGLIPGAIRLRDVLTYIDHDDRDIQYTFLLYVTNVSMSTPITLSDNYSRYQWWGLERSHQEEMTESAKLLLGISAQHIESPWGQNELIETLPTTVTPSSQVIIYSDGGSRGNPGPSASGFVVMDSEENVIHQGGLYLGITTNNQAEYHGVRLGLEKALEMGAKTVDSRMDSLLVVNQLNGIYEIKNHELLPINERIKELITQFDRVTFSHVRREYNQLADGMVNKILNAHAEQSQSDSM